MLLWMQCVHLSVERRRLTSEADLLWLYLADVSSEEYEPKT